MANKKRYTFFTDDYPAVTCDSCYEDQNENYTGPAIERLAEYEATGLMPAEVAALMQELKHAKRQWKYFLSRANFFREVAEVGNRFISVEGFKAFRGTMRITPKTAVPAYDLHGDWLYKPDTKCWHGKGSSFPEDICTIMEAGLCND